MQSRPRRRSVLAAFAVLLASAVLASGCRAEPDDSTPEGALVLFLEAMDQSDWNQHALEDAYGLLSKDAREALAARARRAESLAGRSFEPWEMIAQGRFRLRFAPREPDGLVARVHGDRATVVVRGEADGQRAEVPMVREGGRWRVALEISPVGAR